MKSANAHVQFSYDLAKLQIETNGIFKPWSYASSWIANQTPQTRKGFAKVNDNFPFSKTLHTDIDLSSIWYPFDSAGSVQLSSI